MGFGNSSHVIDLVFHLIGKPMDWNFWHSGTIDWHPSSSKFVGAGITDRNILFHIMQIGKHPEGGGLNY